MLGESAERFARSGVTSSVDIEERDAVDSATRATESEMETDYSRKGRIDSVLDASADNSDAENDGNDETPNFQSSPSLAA